MKKKNLTIYSPQQKGNHLRRARIMRLQTREEAAEELQITIEELDRRESR